MDASFQDDWCYLDLNGQHQGPFPISYLQGLNQSGYFNQEALFWQEGQSEWKQLKDLPQLAQVLGQAPGPAAAGVAAIGATVEAAEAGMEDIGVFEGRDGEGQILQQRSTKAGAVQDAASAAAEMAAATGARRRGGGATLASAPVVVQAAAHARGADGAAGEAPPADAELAGFLAEISALEGEAEEAGQGEAPPASPPPDERTFVDDDGTLYVWNPSLRKFMPSEQPAGYTAEDMVFVAEEEEQPEYRPPPRAGESDEDDEGGRAQEGRGQPEGGNSGEGGTGGEGEKEGNGSGSKRTVQQEAAVDAARERVKKAKAARQQQEGWFELKVNTSVYVTGLPEDVTEQEIVETFSKCGIIKEDDQRRPRIKIYKDKQTGLPKGDGLVTFLKEPSVDLAIQILDGSPLRYGLKPMTVSKARFEQKGEAYVAKQDAGKKRAKKKVLQKLEKDLGWAGFDDILKPQQVTVVLKGMFHPDELVAEPSYKEELEADLKTECAKLGPVDKVRIFAQNPDGMVSVKFKTEEGANACLRVMNGRFFAGRQLEAFKWDGITNYNVKVKETEAEQMARLEKFAKELEGGQQA